MSKDSSKEHLVGETNLLGLEPVDVPNNETINQREIDNLHNDDATSSYDEEDELTDDSGDKCFVKERNNTSMEEQLSYPEEGEIYQTEGTPKGPVHSTDEESNSSESNITSDTTISLNMNSLNKSTTEEESSDEDSDDENPPILKYTRITSKLPKNFFQRDTISCCNFNENAFLFGTHAGILHITTIDFQPLQTLKCHRSSIMSIYCDGTNFATASMDGTVITGSLELPSQLTAFDFKRPVHAVVLDDDYQNTKMFVSGGMAGQVILSQRNWLGNRMDVTLSKGKGSILGIYKLENTIFWFNDDGITFVDIVTKSTLLNIPFSQHVSNKSIDDMSRPDLFRPHVSFPESDRIIIGWGWNIWSLKVSLLSKTAYEGSSHIGSILSSAASSLRGTPDRQVELEHHFHVEMILAGVAPFKDDQLMCLGYDKWTRHDQEDREIQLRSHVPELRIYDIVTGEEIDSEEVMIKNYEKLSINDYHLGKFIYNDSLPQYYLVSATDCIHIQELSLMDHFDWFLSHERLLNAWEVAQYIPEITTRQRIDIGIDYLLQEISLNHWNMFGFNMNKIFNVNEHVDKELRDYIRQEWQTMIFKAINTDHINENLIDNVPMDYDLDRAIFDSILQYELSHERLENFAQLIQKQWDITLFSVDLFEETLEDKIVSTENDETKTNFFRDQLVFLYLQTGKISKAITHLMERNDPKVIDLLLTSPQLIPEFQDSLIEILLSPGDSISSKIPEMTRQTITTKFHKSIQLCSMAIKYISIDRIISEFRNHKGHDLSKLLLVVLETLLVDEPQLMRKQEDEMINLYIQCDREKLLPFLKQKRDYNINEAIDRCTNESGLFNELIYLWGRIGQTNKALKIIIDELQDPQMAIDYVTSWQDNDNGDDLWDFMINYTVQKPEYLKLLLAHADTLGAKYMNVITQMNPQIKVTEVNTTVGKTLTDKSLDVEVVDNLLQLVDDETGQIAQRYLRLSQMGRLFDPLQQPVN